MKKKKWMMQKNLKRGYKHKINKKLMKLKKNILNQKPRKSNNNNNRKMNVLVLGNKIAFLLYPMSVNIQNKVKNYQFNT